jgi:hypothetical protein
MPEAEERQGLQKGQKIGVVLLSIFSVFAVGLGFLQIRNTMYAPFALNNGIPYTVKEDINTNEALIYRDTDKDGLNDFDELYVYITSPYLADTDSDGINDKAEIEKGADPLCPQGQNCNSPILTGEGLFTVSASSSIQEPLPPDQDLSVSLSSPAEIRKMLLADGFDKKILDETSDADLMNMVKQILNSTSSTNPTP